MKANSDQPEAPLKAREAQKRETRQRILKAAIRVFGRDGLASATTQAVATEAKVSHGSVFAHFCSQEQLLVAAIDNFGETASLAIHEALSSGAGLRQVLKVQLRCIEAEEDFYVRLASEAGSLPPAARSSLILMQSNIAFHFLPALQAAEKAGKLKKVAPSLAFNTWLGLLHYYLANRELFAPGESLIAAWGDMLVDHYLNLLGA